MICEKSQVLLFERNTPKRKRGQNSIWYHLTIFFSVKTEGGSPGLVIMGGDSCSKGREFESQHCILDGHISHLFVITIVMFVWKDKNKQKKAEDGPFFSQNRRRCHKTSFRNDAKYIEVSHCQSAVLAVWPDGRIIFWYLAIHNNEKFPNSYFLAKFDWKCCQILIIKLSKIAQDCENLAKVAKFRQI